MKLSFEPNLEFQRDAIKSVTDLFIGQSLDTLGQAFQEAAQGTEGFVSAVANRLSLYFIAETKNTGGQAVDLTKLKTDEQLKIQCGFAHYAEFSGLAYKVVKTPGQLNNL